MSDVSADGPEAWVPEVADLGGPEVLGTMELVPYVGDSDAVRVRCYHCDYERLVKGGTLEQGQRRLAEHYAAKHASDHGGGDPV